MRLFSLRSAFVVYFAYKIIKQYLLMKSTLFPIVTLVLTLAISNDALALSTDREKPAQIEADETEIDFKTGTRILTNNVIVIQGTLRLKADKLVANYKKGELVTAVADGSLARFKQRPDGEVDDVEGWGKKISIDYPTNTLTLLGKASLKQGGTTARGNEIVYNMSTNKLKIKGGRGISKTGKDGSSVSKKKLQDPFADDNKKGPDAAAPNKSKTDVKSSEPEVEAVKSGRSRLILQPRKKTDKKD
jgi:lipopolysaccharide export system protein LptA